MKIPFGIAQIGKAFRNEIVARQFIFRMREFEQMEMQFFVRPGEELGWFKKWKEIRMKWHRALGFGDEHYRFHDHEKLAHYANAATDVEYEFPFGFKEVEGIHSRTDFDLGNHQKFSGKKIQYFDTETGESYVPYVIETSIGVDRMVLQVLSASYEEQKLENGETRVVMHFPPALAPVKAAVLPLVKKDGLPEVAREILHQLKFDFNMQYDEKDSNRKTLPPSGCDRNAVLYYGGSPNLGGSDRNRPVSRFNGTETCSYLRTLLDDRSRGRFPEAV